MALLCCFSEHGHVKPGYRIEEGPGRGQSLCRNLSCSLHAQLLNLLMKSPAVLNNRRARTKQPLNKISSFMTKDAKADPNTHTVNETLKKSYLIAPYSAEKLNTDVLYEHPQSAAGEIQLA